MRPQPRVGSAVGGGTGGRVALVGDMRREARVGVGGRDRGIALIAFPQHGVVSRRQLLALGLSSEAINRRLQAGRLHPVHRGVSAVGHRALSRNATLMAAVLAGGEAGVLSHFSAAELWGLLKRRKRWPDVTVAKA